MDQIPSKKIDPREILPPVIGLMLMGVLLIPGIKQSLGPWFVWAIGLLGLAVVTLIIRAIWRRRSIKEEQAEPTLLPIFIHSDEERAQFRAMMGVKERPPAPIKVVTPQTDDTSSASDSSPRN
jgi:hypothetical protein